MKFKNKIEEFHQMLELLCLIISLGAVFFQIWILISGVQAYFEGKFENIVPAVILSGIAFLVCGVSALLTGVDPMKGIAQGRTKTYQKRD
jgi:hypothetical protein